MSEMVTLPVWQVLLMGALLIFAAAQGYWRIFTRIRDRKKWILMNRGQRMSVLTERKYTSRTWERSIWDDGEAETFTIRTSDKPHPAEAYDATWKRSTEYSPPRFVPDPVDGYQDPHAARRSKEAKAADAAVNARRKARREREAADAKPPALTTIEETNKALSAEEIADASLFDDVAKPVERRARVEYDPIIARAIGNQPIEDVRALWFTEIETPADGPIPTYIIVNSDSQVLVSPGTRPERLRGGKGVMDAMARRVNIEGNPAVIGAMAVEKGGMGDEGQGWSDNDG